MFKKSILLLFTTCLILGAAVTFSEDDGEMSLLEMYAQATYVYDGDCSPTSTYICSFLTDNGTYQELLDSGENFGHILTWNEFVALNKLDSNIQPEDRVLRFDFHAVAKRVSSG